MAGSEETNLILALSLGTLALLVMAGAIIAFVMFYQRRMIAHKLELKTREEEMQHQMLLSAIQSQEEEQRRIARDLHDDLGPMLSAVKLKISQVGRKYEGQGMSAELADSRQMLDITIQQVRGISHRLLPPVLEEYGLVSAIENSCEKLSDENLNIELSTGNEFPRLPKETELALYRVIMELLNNIVKHSGATKAGVQLSFTNSNFEIKVFDNGVGFDAKNLDKTAGLGLRNIKSRLNAINAEISFESQPGNTVAIIRPMQV